MARVKKYTTLLASAARTATPDDIQLETLFPSESRTALSLGNMVNLHLTIDATVDDASASIQPAIVGVDTVSGAEYALLASMTAVASVTSVTYKIGINITTAANTAQLVSIPSSVIIRFTHADADSITYSAGIHTEHEV